MGSVHTVMIIGNRLSLDLSDPGDLNDYTEKQLAQELARRRRSQAESIQLSRLERTRTRKVGHDRRHSEPSDHQVLLEQGEEEGIQNH